MNVCVCVCVRACACVCVCKVDDTSYSLLSVSSLQLFHRGVFQYITLSHTLSLSLSLSHTHTHSHTRSLLNKQYSELLGLQKLKLHSCTKLEPFFPFFSPSTFLFLLFPPFRLFCHHSVVATSSFLSYFLPSWLLFITSLNTF